MRSAERTATVTELNLIDERVRGVEVQMSRLATEMQHLAETAAASQKQMSEQSRIQTDILITMQRDNSERAAISDHLASLIEDMADVKSYVNQERGGNKVKKGIWAATIGFLSSVVLLMIGAWISLTTGGK